ncbi:MAG: exodeoxyribonuclease VII large subunit [Alphaproteobacteria bacterium]|nr:exodeoxyribonuclease VII large subunit [Alphaproteobacteria bacterium]MCW5742108.1 exodeoxyribonuclease VII large subunit [Alphaproteobacteria bacterium]
MTDAVEATGHNAPEFTVSELAFALKREVEQAFPRVRVRGEISQPSFPRSGHCYFRLKDADAVLEAVCWKGGIPRLGMKIEDGLEVIASGRITTYPGSSKYQIVVDRLELAGQGALLKLLEERRKKLAAEGLFAAERKRALPFLPEVIGVITSPSGAVIRDILHRLADRFPRHVLLWPVSVQGERAAGEVAAAIEGFNRLQPGGAVPRPDLLIVARGGGSLEDLWAFNEEVVVRAAAASTIPLISAVGHETDTTLIDFASDYRAPTPTAAAERAVPVRAELLGDLREHDGRLLNALTRRLREAQTELAGLSRGLPDPRRLIEERAQRVDDSAERLAKATVNLVALKRSGFDGLGARLRTPREVIERKGRELAEEWRVLLGGLRGYLGDARQKGERAGDRMAVLSERLARATAGLVEQHGTRVESLGKLLDSYSFKGTLARGFALVRDTSGAPLLSATAAAPGTAVSIEFGDGRVGATIDAEPRPAAPRPQRAAPRHRGGAQGDLF